jgi:hypothetical protein
MKIDNTGFVPNSTILFLTMLVKIVEFERFIGTRKMRFYVVYQNLTDEILQVHFRGESTNIPLRAVVSAEIVKPENLTDDVNHSCYEGILRFRREASSYLEIISGQGLFGSREMEFFEPGEKIPK